MDCYTVIMTKLSEPMRVVLEKYILPSFNLPTIRKIEWGEWKGQIDDEWIEVTVDDQRCILINSDGLNLPVRKSGKYLIPYPSEHPSEWVDAYVHGYVKGTSFKPTAAIELKDKDTEGNSQYVLLFNNEVSDEVQSKYRISQIDSGIPGYKAESYPFDVMYSFALLK